MKLAWVLLLIPLTSAGFLEYVVACPNSISYRLNSMSDPDINLTVGDTVVFVISSNCNVPPTHPFQIQLEGVLFTSGTTNNVVGGTTTGNVTLQTDNSTPPLLTYQCLTHAIMTGKIFINTPAPTQPPSNQPSLAPSSKPTTQSTTSPTHQPNVQSISPTLSPITSHSPSSVHSPSQLPTFQPSLTPTSKLPTISPTTSQPTRSNSSSPMISSGKPTIFANVSDTVAIIIIVLGCFLVCVVVIGLLCVYKKRKKSEEQARRLKQLQERTEEIHKSSAHGNSNNDNNNKQELTNLQSSSPKSSPSSLPRALSHKPAPNLYVQSQRELQDLAVAIDTITPKSTLSPTSTNEEESAVAEPASHQMNRSSTTWLVESMMNDLSQENSVAAHQIT